MKTSLPVGTVTQPNINLCRLPSLKRGGQVERNLGLIFCTLDYKGITVDI